jgi:hypothetical protein
VCVQTSRAERERNVCRCRQVEPVGAGLSAVRRNRDTRAAPRGDQRIDVAGRKTRQVGRQYHDLPRALRTRVLPRELERLVETDPRVRDKVDLLVRSPRS